MRALYEEEMSDNKLKNEAGKWWTVHVFTSFTQTCFFTAWVMVLLYVVSAPAWAWVVGSVYVVSHWVSMVAWLMGNYALTKWKESVIEEK